MLTVQLNEFEIEQRFKEELKKRLDEISHRTTFWDANELRKRTCMSWNTIQKEFFFDERFPKHKVGNKWYFPAKEAEAFLLQWLSEQDKS